MTGGCIVNSYRIGRCDVKDGHIPKDIPYGELASGRRTKATHSCTTGMSAREMWKHLTSTPSPGCTLQPTAWCGEALWTNTSRQGKRSWWMQKYKEGPAERSATTPTDQRPHTNAILRQRLFLPHRSLQPQVTLQRSNRQDNHGVLPWSNLIDRGHIYICRCDVTTEYVKLAGWMMLCLHNLQMQCHRSCMNDMCHVTSCMMGRCSQQNFVTGKCNVTWTVHNMCHVISIVWLAGVVSLELHEWHYGWHKRCMTARCNITGVVLLMGIMSLELCDWQV